MSQAKVTEFFATRKRNLFNQDQVLLAKQKRTHSLVEKDANNLAESPCLKAVEEAKMVTRSTRSTRSSKAKEEPEVVKEQEQVKENDAPVENKEPVPEEAPKKVRKSKKKELEELKQKIAAFDEKAKLVKRTTRGQKGKESEEKETPPAPEPPVQEPTIEAPKAQEAKEETAKKETPVEKKQLKADLRQKIAEFNQNFVIAQQKQQAAAAAKPAEEPKPAPAPVNEKELPAYIKYQDLASAQIDSTCTLTLPKTYSMLLNAFKACDSIVKFHNGSQAVCTFLRLKLGVQNLIKTKFEKLHLGQIKTVYPQAYVYNVEKLFIDFKNDYHLTISLNYDEVQPDAEGKKVFNSLVLLQRFNYFKNKLFSMVKDLHQEFLKSMNISIDAKDIKRWHPGFNLDSVKPIEASELPEHHLDQVQTSRDLLSIADNVYNKRIKEAIHGMVAETNAKLAEQKLEAEKATKKVELVVEFEEPPPAKEAAPAAVKLPAVPAAVVAPAPPVKATVVVTSTPAPAASNSDDYLAKLKEKKEKSYNDILERVKAKEKAKAIESMIINSDREKQLAKYQNVAEATRLLSFFYDSEKKSIAELAKACQVLADNLNARLNSLESRELIDEMCAEPLFTRVDEAGKTQQWLTIVKVRLQMYLKVDKSFDVIQLRQKIDEKIEQIKQNP